MINNLNYRDTLIKQYLFLIQGSTGKKVKVKVSHSLIAVGAVGVRVPLYLGHS